MQPSIKRLFTIAAVYCIIAFIAGLLIGSIEPNLPKVATKQADSTEYAVYTARPVDYPEDCVPVYVPLDILGICELYDIVYIDTATNILAPMPLRDAETH